MIIYNIISACFTSFL